jgi:transcriptional regulator with PAS, ATPase and Fis domain
MVTQNKDTEYGLPWKPRNTWLIPPGLEETIKRFEIQCINNINNDSRPLLIHGPTGTGKSMFVDYYAFIYTNIKGKTPSIAYINCAALPSALIDSLLFGHTKGAFTGADKNKIGYFESVKDGIIVLEEMGEMPKHLQAKLLLAIESRIFSKLGSVTPIKLECQILATQNVQKTKFRD